MARPCARLILGVLALSIASVCLVSADVESTEASAEAASNSERSTAGPIYLDTWAIQLKNIAGKELHELDAIAENIAARKNFVNLGRIGSLPGAYHFAPSHLQSATSGVHRRHTREDGHTEALHADDEVEWAEQQHVLSRRKRSVVGISLERDADGINRRQVSFNDPAFGKQWHLYNVGQASGPKGADLNVYPAWNQGFTGKGVVVSVLDDGLEHTNEELKGNYDPHASWDFNDNDNDPLPRYEYSNLNKHGTRCAGEIGAAAKNGNCGVGIAYECKIGGVRMLDGDVSDSVEASSLGFRQDYVDIYSSSWGPDDDGRTVDGPRGLARASFAHGVTNGRGGKGSIFVFASGNGGSYKDNCNCDGYTNSMYTISIGSVTDTNKAPWYTEQCAATMAVTYSSGSNGINHSITTCDFRFGCTDAHSGTSAAAPLAAGVIALGLQANPSLSWRDVQHIVVLTSRVIDESDPKWSKNGAGLSINHKYGFGVMDAAMFVHVAQSWVNVGTQFVYTSPKMQPNMVIPYGGVGAVATVTVPASSGIVKTEHVQVTATIRHRRRGDLAILLTSPSGTISELLTERPYDYSSEGFESWTFMTVRNWNENPQGTWVFAVRDVANEAETGSLVQWQLIVYGTGEGGVVAKVSSTVPPSSSSTPPLPDKTTIASLPRASSPAVVPASITHGIVSETTGVMAGPSRSSAPVVPVSVPVSVHASAVSSPAMQSTEAAAAVVSAPAATENNNAGVTDDSDSSGDGDSSSGTGFSAKFNFIPLVAVVLVIAGVLLVAGAVVAYRRRTRAGFVPLSTKDADGEHLMPHTLDDDNEDDGERGESRGGLGFANPLIRAANGDEIDYEEEDLLFDASQVR